MWAFLFSTELIAVEDLIDVGNVHNTYATIALGNILSMHADLVLYLPMR